MIRRLALLTLTVALALAGVATAYIAEPFRIYEPGPVENNPAEALVGKALEPVRSYGQEVPKRCTKRKNPGVSRFARWLDKRMKHGGPGRRYACENLGKGIGYSFHSEGRALDFSINALKYAQYKEAYAALRLLWAPDSKGRPHALARRMGVMEIIFECGYWSQGKANYELYFLCNQPNEPKGRALRTLQHQDHIHFSFTRKGAAGKTSFWKR